MALGGLTMHLCDFGFAGGQARDRHLHRVESGLPVGLVEYRRAPAYHGRKDDVWRGLLDPADDLLEIPRTSLKWNINFVQHLAPALHDEVGHQAIGFVRI